MIKKLFKNNGDDFSGYYDAGKYLDNNNYSNGTMCGDLPIAIVEGNFSIGKWKNINPGSINGIIISNNFRNSDVKIIIFENDEKYNPDKNYLKE